MNLGLPFPGVELKGIKTMKHFKRILLLPIFPTFLFLFLSMLIIFMYSWVNLYNYIIWSIDFAMIFTFLFCSGDITLVKKYNKIQKNIKNWFIYVDKNLSIG